MKKWFIFGLAGGIILFVWQFLSFAMPNFHKAANEFTPLQDTLLADFKALGLKDGMYMLGMPDPDSQESGMQMSGETYTWATLNYKVDDSTSMTTPMLRSIVIDILVSILLFFILAQIKNPSLLKRVALSIAIGLIAFFYIAYSSFIWYKEPDIFAYLMDAIVPWAILGWLGDILIKKEEV